MQCVPGAAQYVLSYKFSGPQPEGRMIHPNSIASHRNVTDVALFIEIGSSLPPLPIHLHSRQATQKFIICGMPSSRTLPFSPHSHFLLNVCFRIQCASTQSCNIQLHCFLGVDIFTQI